MKPAWKDLLEGANISRQENLKLLMVFTRYLRKEEEESILLQVLTNQTKGKSLYTTTSKDSTSPLTCFKFNKTHTSHHLFMSTQTHLWAPFPKIKIFLSSEGSNSSVYLLLCQRILQSWRLRVLVHHHVLLNTETKQKMRIRKSKLELFEDSLSSPCLPASFHTQAQRIWTVIEKVTTTVTNDNPTNSHC